MQVVLSIFFRYSRNSRKFDASKNYYRILNLEFSSSKSAIRNSYLNLAKKYHPDINPKGSEVFALIQQAYQVLSNEWEKKQYDRFYLDFIEIKKQQQYSQREKDSSYFSTYQSGSRQQTSEFKGQRMQTQQDDLKKKRQEWTKQYYELNPDKRKENRKKQGKQQNWVDQEYQRLQRAFQTGKAKHSQHNYSQGMEWLQRIKHILRR